MLKIASYSLRGQVVRVKLKCTCGDGKILEIQEDGETVFFCSRCRNRKTLEQLKKEASTYWRSRKWVVECEPDQRVQPRIHVDYGVELTIRATRYSPTYCSLHGRMLVLSESGALVVVEDFKESYFEDITSAYRYVEVALTKPIESFPPHLTGRIVGVRFRPDELPLCRIGIGFEGLSEEDSNLLRQHIEQHAQKQSPPESGGENK